MLRGYESGQPRSRFMRRLGPPTRDPPGDSTLPRIGTLWPTQKEHQTRGSPLVGPRLKRADSFVRIQHRRCRLAGPGPMSLMTSRRVLHTVTAPAKNRSSARTAEPAVTPTATIAAALAATMSQVESPTYQHRLDGTPRTREAFSSRSGAGLACATSRPSIIVGGRGRRNPTMDAPTCSCRLEVAIAHGMLRASSIIKSSREPGNGFGSTLRVSNISPCRRSMLSAR